VQDLHIARRPDQFKTPNWQELTAWYRERLSDHASKAWIAEEAGAPVGYVLAMHHARPSTPFAPARDWYEIDQLAVDQAHRRRGIGHALLQQALAAARDRGYRTVEVSVWAFNADMQRLLHRVGFTAKVGRLEIHTGL
jgi:GNAT superfamily N-acetyltransferase